MKIPFVETLLATSSHHDEERRGKLRLYRLILSRAQQIHVQTHRPGNACGQLAEEGVAGVDIGSLAVLRPQQAALLRVFSRIVTGQQRGEMRVPLIYEIQP